MTKGEGTVIWVSRETKARLLRLKSYPRETVGDVIKRILDDREHHRTGCGERPPPERKGRERE